MYKYNFFSCIIYYTNITTFYDEKMIYKPFDFKGLLVFFFFYVITIISNKILQKRIHF